MWLGGEDGVRPSLSVQVCDRQAASTRAVFTNTPIRGDPVCTTLRWETRSRNLKYLQRVLPFPQQRSTGDSDSGHTCFLRVVRTGKERGEDLNVHKKPQPEEGNATPGTTGVSQRTNERANEQTNKQPSCPNCTKSLLVCFRSLSLRFSLPKAIVTFELLV